MRGLDPELKHARAANYVRALRGELLSLSRALGQVHPALVLPSNLEIVSERYSTASLAETFGYERTVTDARREEIVALLGPPKTSHQPGPQVGPVPGDGSGVGGDAPIAPLGEDGASLAAAGD